MTYCGKERPSLDSWQALEQCFPISGHFGRCGNRTSLDYETELSQEARCIWRREGATVPSR